MKKLNPISFIEESLSSLKNFIDEQIPEIDESKNTIDSSFLKQLETENILLLNACKELNSDARFIEKINSRIVNPKNDFWYKTEQIFLSEMITVYNENKSTDVEKSQFVLAYFYDVLRNNYFAGEQTLNSLNQLIKSTEFSGIIDKIKKENQLQLQVPSDKNIVLSVLAELNHPKFEAMESHFQNYRKISGFPEAEKFVKPVVSEITQNQQTQPQENNLNVTQAPEGDTLEKAMEELNNLVGLEKVKKDINELINLLEIQKKRDVEGLKNIEIALHTVFLGPPGTGKTSVARLLSRIFKHLGYLSKGQLYETDREGLIAGYVGQTAIKTGKAVEESKGGVLFIDEAYSLTQNQAGNDFGSEAVNTIIKRMEDFRDDFAVVVAGYTEPMQIFIESNPGLRSRFNRYFYFEHFTSEQLFLIFENFCKKSDFLISTEAKEKIIDTFSLMESLKTESFGNARVVRNLFEKSVQNQANRLIHWSAPKNEFLKTLHEEDIPDPKETLESIKVFKIENKENSETEESE